MSATILCIDDSQTIQQAVEIVFAYEGFQIVKASSGQAGIAAAGQVQPNLVLLDSSLPGEDPYQVCQALRATPNTAQVPIVMMSGSAVPFDADKARAAGSSDQIAKPFESKGLIEKVRQLTGITDRPAPPAAPPKTEDLPKPPSAMPTPTAAPSVPAFSTPAAPVTPAAARPAASHPVMAAPSASPSATGAQWQPMASAASSTPPVAAPAVTTPPAAAPSVAAPAVTTPPAAAPSVAAPTVTAPPVVTPSVIAPPAAAPAVVSPSAAAPAVSSPAETVATKSSAEKSAFDPFGLSLDDDADDALDISVDDNMGAEPIEMTLEPPPKPGSQAAIENTSLATPLTDLEPVDAPSAMDEMPPLELTEEMPTQASAAADIAPSEPVETKPVVTDSPVSETAAAASVDGGVPDKGVLTAAIREMVEQVVWEVIPELAETMIREELDRLLRERGVDR